MASATGSYSASLSWTAGHAGLDYPALILAALRTSATTPVQHKELAGTIVTPNLDLDSAPTEGNIIVMSIGTRSKAVAWDVSQLYPTSGWTKLGEAQGNPDAGAGGIHTNTVAMYARCVVAGEGTTYGLQSAGSKENEFAVQEWAVS